MFSTVWQNNEERKLELLMNETTIRKYANDIADKLINYAVTELTQQTNYHTDYKLVRSTYMINYPV